MYEVINEGAHSNGYDEQASQNYWARNVYCIEQMLQACFVYRAYDDGDDLEFHS